jgi:hypothetical protein
VQLVLAAKVAPQVPLRVTPDTRPAYPNEAEMFPLLVIVEVRAYDERILTEPNVSVLGDAPRAAAWPVPERVAVLAD